MPLHSYADSNLTPGEVRTLIAMLTAIDVEDVCAYIVVCVPDNDHGDIRVASNLNMANQAVLLTSALGLVISANEVAGSGNDRYDGD